MSSKSAYCTGLDLYRPLAEIASIPHLLGILPVEAGNTAAAWSLVFRMVFKQRLLFLYGCPTVFVLALQCGYGIGTAL
ncbi:hypothetical protein J6590_015743 [Homalodisca vitripennis]|nr:hypothetical protein J6590_015743 [Homalodisca vitripennis]